jgi:hypothetical protein
MEKVLLHAHRLLREQVTLAGLCGPIKKEFKDLKYLGTRLPELDLSSQVDDIITGQQDLPEFSDLTDTQKAVIASNHEEIKGLVRDVYHQAASYYACCYLILAEPVATKELDTTAEQVNTTGEQTPVVAEQVPPITEPVAPPVTEQTPVVAEKIAEQVPPITETATNTVGTDEPKPSIDVANATEPVATKELDTTAEQVNATGEQNNALIPIGKYEGVGPVLNDFFVENGILTAEDLIKLDKAGLDTLLKSVTDGRLRTKIIAVFESAKA